jgi:hypothetical protein
MLYYYSRINKETRISHINEEKLVIYLNTLLPDDLVHVSLYRGDVLLLNLGYKCVHDHLMTFEEVDIKPVVSRPIKRSRFD